MASSKSFSSLYFHHVFYQFPSILSQFSFTISSTTDTLPLHPSSIVLPRSRTHSFKSPLFGLSVVSVLEVGYVMCFCYNDTLVRWLPTCLYANSGSDSVILIHVLIIESVAQCLSVGHQSHHSLFHASCRDNHDHGSSRHMHDVTSQCPHHTDCVTVSVCTPSPRLLEPTAQY